MILRPNKAFGRNLGKAMDSRFSAGLTNLLGTLNNPPAQPAPQQ
jgi:hypothetical protein